jgi:hypothetical protein
MNPYKTVDLIENNYVAKAIHERMLSDLRKALKQPLMEKLEAEIDAMIDKVVADLNVETHIQKNFGKMGYDVLFAVHRRDRA